jgi:hypothetical protein
MVVDTRDLLAVSLYNQHLLKKAPCKTVVADLSGLQAQFANNPKYALLFRGNDFDENHWQEGLITMWSFRKTLHTILKEELGLFLSAREVPSRWQDAWEMEGTRLRYWAGFLAEQIGSGICEREALKKKCREKGMSGEEQRKAFNGWGGVIYEMNRRGMIAYHPGTAKKFVLCEPMQRLDRDEARAILLRRYFRFFGPATLEDYRYFTGYRKREIDALLKRGPIEPHILSCQGKDYWYLGDLPAADIPACLFLPGFDQLLMGYRDRSRLLDEKYKNAVTTNSGIVFPTVLLRGRLQAKWKKDGETLLVTPFGSLVRKDKRLITETGEAAFGGSIREFRFCGG